MHEDRERWNRRYAAGDHAGQAPSSLLLGLSDWLPSTGRALDVAGGAGRHAVWLARRGLDVTLVDIAERGLELARDQAVAAGIELTTICQDVQEQPLPPGPWDLILVVHFLHRPLFAQFAGQLAPGGTLIVLQPTRSNLARHARPPAGFLLEDGELPGLVSPSLTIMHMREGWLEEGRHDALLVARRLA